VSSARNVLVTSAARGLARGIVIDLVRSGYRVAFTYRPDGTSPEQTLGLARAVGPGPVVAIPADHGTSGETERGIAAAQDALGPIDAYVHAVGPIVVKRFASCGMDDYRTMIAGNFESAVEGAFAVLPSMRERGFGRLVFFGMNGSHVTQPSVGMSLYGGAKAAVVTFARALSLEEAARGITVNVVEPGDIRNKDADRAAARNIPANNPTGHAGSWEDVAFAVRTLLGPEAEFINGSVIGVNGGLVEAYE
jgi:3-oxoacyl-[acyl-carrier protein] reductase